MQNSKKGTRRLPAWFLVVFGVLFLGVLVWLKSEFSYDEKPPALNSGLETSKALRPAETKRAQLASRLNTIQKAAQETRAASPTPSASPVEETKPPYEIDICLSELSRRQRQWVTQRIILRASSFWPSPDEAPLPESQVTALHQWLLDFESLPHEERHPRFDEWKGQTDRFLELAAAEGFTADAVDVKDDPWGALLALEVERRARRENLRKEQVEYDKAMEAAGGAGGSLPVPRLDLRTLVKLGQAIIDAHPGSPVADYAWMYVLHGYQDYRSNMRDPEKAREVAMRVIESSQDPLTRGNALSMISFVGPEFLAPSQEQRAVMLEAVRSETDTEVRLAASQYLLDCAFFDEDWKEAETALERFEDAARALCEEDPGSRECGWVKSEVQASRGQLGMATGRKPEGWEEALVYVAWDCHSRSPRTNLASSAEDPDARTRKIEGVGAWHDGGWHWREWSPSEDVFTLCFEERTAQLTAPPEDRTVQITMIRTERTAAPVWGGNR